MERVLVFSQGHRPGRLILVFGSVRAEGWTDHTQQSQLTCPAVNVEELSVDERRTFKRIAVEAVFMYELQDCPDADEVAIHSMGTAVIHNISIGGARVRTLGQQLPKGSRLRATIMSLTEGEVVEVTGRIVWSKHVESETFDSGIEFLDYKHDTKERLQNFIDKLCVETA